MITISAILISHNDKYLLVQENKPNDIGWTISAGRVGGSESPEEGAIREAEEETGLEVEANNLLKTFRFDEKDTEVKVYKGRAVGGSLKLNEKECMGLGWFSREEIEHLDLRREFILEAIKTDIKNIKNPKA
ncbi:hypothetical protein COT65_00180 [Candidatus Shapirobacteria bacterium CG09_land_8_20_14_0_10_47_13]|uniref:Nudix hydrolase domain-containing protein n=1 Tax=Candidatus Shapirobacteria bacterium CG09_land_8_20_14_0_10_47_13 TaxID=1974481 RepID=A0A2H0WNJ0_9BACT|nr:MAG: hypothetical protein COT65_00180 [Candidatus Shapirobacteria bacterium CG09_land_8_20_14_0_10_47_13]